MAALGLRCCVRTFSSCGYSSLQCAGFSLRWLLSLWSIGSRHTGFSSCGTQAQSLWCAGLVAPRHVGSSWTRARTRVPCIGRQILNYCATREVLPFSFHYHILNLACRNAVIVMTLDQINLSSNRHDLSKSYIKLPQGNSCHSKFS